MDEFKVIVKREKEDLVLFFPETPANPGNIEVWDGCHNEANLGYFWSLKNPRPDQDVDKLLRHYERLYQCAGPFKLKRVFRDNQNMRSQRWQRSG